MLHAARYAIAVQHRIVSIDLGLLACHWRAYHAGNPGHGIAQRDARKCVDVSCLDLGLSAIGSGVLDSGERDAANPAFVLEHRNRKVRWQDGGGCTVYTAEDTKLFEDGIVGNCSPTQAMGESAGNTLVFGLPAALPLASRNLLKAVEIY